MIKVRRQEKWSKILLGCLLSSLLTISGIAFSNDFRRFDSQNNTNFAPSVNEYSNFVAKKNNSSAAAKKKADGLRQKTIRSIKSLLSSGALKGNQKFELMMRLGETHVERHDYLRKLEYDLYDRNYEKWERKVRKIYRLNPDTPREKYPVEPRLDETQSNIQLTQAANSFRKVVAEFPKHPRGDEALFLLAQTLTRLKNDNAVQYLHDLEKRYPKSRLLPDTFLALGENYFEKGEVKPAIKYYRRAAKYKTHPAFPYAVYKLGWSYYNAGAKEEGKFKKYMSKAAKSFKLVVKLSDSNKFNTGRIDLKDEALNDLVMVWAETEQIKTAWNYFRQLGKKDKFYSMLERMGNIYVEQGKNKKAILVYSRLLKESPLRENNPLIYEKLVALHEATQNLKNVVKTILTMQDLYIGRTAWNSKFSSDKDLRKETYDMIVRTMQHYGTKFHDLGQRTNNKNLLGAAAEVYDGYLKTFHKTKEAYEIRFYLAEILYGFKKYNRAADHYLIVSKRDGEFLYDAALNAVISMNSFVEGKKYKEPSKKKLGKLKNPLVIPKGNKKLIVMIDNFVKRLPKKEEGIPMRYNAAEVNFKYGHYKEAIRRFKDITKVAPKSEQAESAVKMVVGFHAENKRWVDVIKTGEWFEKNQVLLSKKSIKDYLFATLKFAIFSMAQDFEKAKKHRLAAQKFIQYAMKFPKDKNADRSLYNASLNYYKIGALQDALKVSMTLLKTYPESKLRPEVTAKLATTYEATANFPMAADLYAELSGLKQAKAEQRAAALYNAGVLYKGLKKYKASIKAFEEYIQKYPRGPSAVDSLKELALTSELSGDLKKASAAFTRYSKVTRVADEILEARAKAAVLNLRLAQNTETIGALVRIGNALAQDNKNPAYQARYLISKTMFALAGKKIAAFRAAPFRNGAKIEQEVGIKNKALNAIAKDLEGVISIGNAEMAVASLYSLGELHEQLSKDLFKAPAPRGANTEQINQYRSSLEKVAFPLREQANKYYVEAYKRSKEIRSFTEWSKKTRSKMAEIEPAKYENITTENAKPSYLGHKLYLKGAVKGLAEE